MSTNMAGCAHVITLDGETCGRPPTVHLATYDYLTGTVEQASCRRHASLIGITANIVAEHPYRPGCSAGRCWPINDNRVRDIRQPRTSKRLPTTNRVVGVALVAIAAVVILVVGFMLAVLLLPGRPL